MPWIEEKVVMLFFNAYFHYIAVYSSIIDLLFMYNESVDCEIFLNENNATIKVSFSFQVIAFQVISF